MLKIFHKEIEQNSPLRSIVRNLKYQRVEISECDYIFHNQLFLGIADYNELHKICIQFKDYPKKVILFLVTDNCVPLKNLENVIIFSTSLYKSQQLSYEKILPYIWECSEKSHPPLGKISEKKIAFGLFPSMKIDKPIVGFCGQAKNLERKDMIKSCNNSKDIISNFITRKKFWGGKPQNITLINEFNENIKNSHFIICSRGTGNFSMRLYQTMAFGRIPILIDSDMVFPFEDLINWDTFIIRGKTSEEVIEKVISWWQTKNIEQIQLRNREVFEEYLSPKGFGNKLGKLISSSL